MQLRQLFELIRKWFWLIALTAFIGAAVGLAVHHYLPKKYQAAATIFVNTPNHMDESSLVGAQQAAKALASLPQTQPILEATLQKIGAEGLSETQLDKMVTVTNDLDSQYVVIQVTDTDPVRAASLASTLAKLSINAFQGTAMNGTNTKFLLNEMAALQNQISIQEEQLGALEQQSPATPTQTDMLNQITTTLNALRLQYSQDVNTYNQLTSIQATLVQDAQVPQNPIGLGGSISAALGLLISLIAIVGVIIIIEQSDDVLRTPEKVEKATGLPTFLTLKRLPPTIKKLPWLSSIDSDSEVTVRLKSAKELARLSSSLPNTGQQDETKLQSAVLTQQSNLISRDHLNGSSKVGSHYVLPESFLALGVLLSSDTNDHQQTPVRHGRAMLVTSPENGDGKTLVASQIALGLARTGTKVILIDTNLRSPQIHKIFGVTNGTGLSTILYGDKVRNVDEAIFDTQHGALRLTAEPNLMILPSGPQIEAAPVLLSSSGMVEAIGLLSRDAFVIIDSPAVLTASEATILASKCDDILMVVNAQRTTAARLNQSLRMLTYLHVPVRGVVLNQVGKSYQDK